MPGQEEKQTDREPRANTITRTQKHAITSAYPIMQRKRNQQEKRMPNITNSRSRKAGDGESKGVGAKDLLYFASVTRESPES